jgi:hypothetical protein
MLGLFIVLLLAGCQEYVAGVATGAAAVQKLNEDAQARFIETINAVNDRTDELNEMIESTNGTVILKPETIEAAISLKGREKDPVTWIAIMEALGLMFLGGKAVKKKQNGS